MKKSGETAVGERTGTMALEGAELTKADQDPQESEAAGAWSVTLRG
jgi:hypothetical protein